MCAVVWFKSHGVLMILRVSRFAELLGPGLGRAYLEDAARHDAAIADTLVTHIAASAYLQAPLVEPDSFTEPAVYPRVTQHWLNGPFAGQQEPLYPGKVFTPRLPPVGALLQRSDGLTVRVTDIDSSIDCIIGRMLGTGETVTIPFEALTISVD
jgi:hypothetical protein